VPVTARCAHRRLPHAQEASSPWDPHDPGPESIAPNPVRVSIFRVRIILAGTRESYKAATNFVFFVLAENDNNYEKD
jgi:hypothetical protein